jgi:hypothetical protein
MLRAAYISDQPDKAGNPTDAMVAGSEPIELGTDIEILALHPDHLAFPAFLIVMPRLDPGILDPRVKPADDGKGETRIIVSLR